MPFGYDECMSASAFYAYVGNDPLNSADPMGLAKDSPDSFFPDPGAESVVQRKVCMGMCHGYTPDPYAPDLSEANPLLFKVLTMLPGLIPGIGLAERGVLAAEGIATPYGIASQEFSSEALAARDAVQNAAQLYRGGTLGRSAGPEAQFWSLENPLNPRYAERFGIPAENMKFDFVETGTLHPGTNFITRAAPGIGSNGGGAIEIVTPPGGVGLNQFTMP